MRAAVVFCGSSENTHISLGNGFGGTAHSHLQCLTSGLWAAKLHIIWWRFFREEALSLGFITELTWRNQLRRQGEPPAQPLYLPPYRLWIIDNKLCFFSSSSHTGLKLPLNTSLSRRRRKQGCSRWRGQEGCENTALLPPPHVLLLHSWPSSTLPHWKLDKPGFTESRRLQRQEGTELQQWRNLKLMWVESTVSPKHRDDFPQPLWLVVHLLSCVSDSQCDVKLNYLCA